MKILKPTKYTKITYGITMLMIAFVIFLYFFLGIWLKEFAKNNFNQTAHTISGSVQKEIADYFTDAIAINNVIAQNTISCKGMKIERYNTYKFLEEFLRSNSWILAVWTMWEPNAYDNKDAQYSNDSLHDTQGTFAMAYYFDNDTIKFEINEMEDFNEDYYTIPKKSQKIEILPPFFYQYHGNSKIYYETSIVTPIIENNKFLGVVGIDIDLQMLQQHFSKIKVFETGFVSIISSTGQIVTHPDTSLIEKNLFALLSIDGKEISTQFLKSKEFESLGTSFTNKKVQRFFYPIVMPSKKDTWYIMIEIPYSEIYKSVSKIQWLSFISLCIITLFLTYLIYNFFIVKKNEKELYKYRNHLELLVKERTDELSASNEELISQREEIQQTLEQLEQTQNQLIHSEKMAALGVLSAGIAHEINNPLNFIQGGVHGITSYFNDIAPEKKPQVEGLLYAIEQGVNRATEIVKSLSHYSRNNDVVNYPCNVHLAIDNSLIMLQNNLKNKVTIIKKYTNSECIVLGNESKLQQVFVNIISNAEQAIEKQGTITIQTSIKNSKIEIIIFDTGCGISEEISPKIFDPFFTTKPPGKGSGLGLSISYSIISDLKGTIKYNSKEGEGTEVIISLPVYES